MLDIEEIKRVIPHRYPFLLVDRVVEVERLKRLVALKNVTRDEPFFEGHFPGAPVMPGVLIIEAIAQAGAVLMLQEIENRDSQLVLFTGIDRARFRRPVRPGDQLMLTVEVLKWRPRAVKMTGRAEVDGLHRVLLDMGAEILDPPQAFPQYTEGYYAVFFLDPDGIKLELAHTPGADWRAG